MEKIIQPKIEIPSLVVAKAAILDSNGRPILHYKDKSGDDWAVSSRIVDMKPSDLDETVTLFSASGKPIVHNSHRKGDHFYERSIDGKVDSVLYVPKESVAPEPNYGTVRFGDYLQPVWNTLKAAWQNKGKVAAGIAVVAFPGLASREAKAQTYEKSWHYDIPADFNYDGTVNGNDLMEMANHWLTPGYISDANGPGVDMNKDGIVNNSDLAQFANQWGRQANATRIAVYTSQATSIPGEEGHPYKETLITIYNDSPINPDYEIDELIFGTGSNNGINSLTVAPDWSYSFGSDETVTWTVGNRIFPGASKNNFSFGVYGEQGSDPNSIKYENAPVRASTIMEYSSLPVDIPLPKSNP